MKARRPPSRFAALVGAPPADVLTATRRHLDAHTLPLERAMRTAAAVAVTPDDWQWPRWLDRQLRANHPAFVAGGDAAVIENVTGRDWRHVGTVSSGCLATVDPRGLVVPVSGGWSLDWLVGAEDRWHRPAREAGVRQRIVAGAPVVETACRVPGGDIVHRVYGVTLGGSRRDAIVVEVENQTAVPVALAFAVRPADLLGAGSITDLALEDGNVLVDGRPVVVFDRTPARSATGDAHTDSIAAVVLGDAAADPHAPRRDLLGLANATYVLPLTHRTTLRVVLVFDVDRRDRASFPDELPTAAAVANGWSSHADRGATIELPDERLNRFWTEALGDLLLASGGGAVSAPPGLGERWRVVDEARVVRSLQLAGLSESAGAVLRRRGDEFELDGWFRREDPSLDRNAAIFGAVGDAWQLARDRDTVDAVLGPTVKAAHWTERHRARHATRLSARDSFGMHDAMLALAEALDGIEQPEAAEDVRAFAARFVLDHDEPSGTSDAGGAGADAGDADVSSSSATSLQIATRAGIDCRATVDRALALAGARDEGAFASVAWLAEVAADRGRWPTFVHPRLGTGSAGAGDDPLVAAAVVELVRAFVIDVGADTIALLPMFPDAWLGQSIDVRDLPTPFGPCSFAIRWHGARPALLWELRRHEDQAGRPPVSITVPGLDPAFRTTDLSGEALLAAPPSGTPGAGQAIEAAEARDATDAAAGEGTPDAGGDITAEPGASFS